MRVKQLCVASVMAFAFAVGSPAQSTRPGIRGVVLEPSTKQPVVDADISLYFLGEEPPKIRVGLGLLTPAFITRTDFTGAFTFQLEKLGYYTVAAKKENYSSPAMGRSSENVTLSAEEPVKEARLFLSLPGSLTGHVVDDETRKPIANVRVVVAPLTNLNGRRTFFGGGASTTGADGTFAASNLAPGDYVAIVDRQRHELLPKFTDDDLKKTDQDFARTFWPGGHGEEAAIPVTLNSVAAVEIGELRMKKITYYRVHVRMPPSTCGPGDNIQIYEAPLSGPGMTGITEQAPCRQDMLITGFPPGSYRLILAVHRKSAADREMASIPFVVVDENVTVTAPLERGVVVEGAFVPAEGASPPDFAKLQIRLRAFGMIPYADIASPVKPDDKGRFRFVGIPVLDHQVYAYGTDAGHYVKEIRYNGSLAANDIARLDKSAVSHSLTVVVDDKPATITGTVSKGDKPVSRSYVILAHWPLPTDGAFSPAAATTGDEKGAFQLAGLAPGEYRVIAVTSNEDYIYRAPNVLERALATAKKIEIGASGFQNVALELSELK
jgi:hypothetical protein